MRINRRVPRSCASSDAPKTLQNLTAGQGDVNSYVETGFSDIGTAEQLGFKQKHKISLDGGFGLNQYSIGLEREGGLTFVI